MKRRVAMRALVGSAVLALASIGPAFGAPVLLRVGDAGVLFEPPIGWCIYPEALTARIGDYILAASAENVIHVVFGECGQVQRALAAGERVRDYGILMTPRVAANADAGTDRAGLVALMTKTMLENGAAPEFGAARDRVNAVRRDIRVGQTIPLGMLAVDANGVYSGMMMRWTFGPQDVTIVGSYGMTLASRRLLSYYLYGDYLDQDSVGELVTRTKLEIARLTTLNPR